MHRFPVCLAGGLEHSAEEIAIARKLESANQLIYEPVGIVEEFLSAPGRQINEPVKNALQAESAETPHAGHMHVAGALVITSDRRCTISPAR